MDGTHATLHVTPVCIHRSPRAYRAAFASLERRMGDRPSTSFTAHLTCVEIYNEQVRGRRLRITAR